MARQVPPPPLVHLVSEAVALGYEIPDVETGDIPSDRGPVPAVQVTLSGNERLRDVQAVCRVLRGPAKERTRLAARSALAEALRLATAADAIRT